MFGLCGWKTECSIVLRILNMGRQSKLFANKFTPLYSYTCDANYDIDSLSWRRLPHKNVVYVLSGKEGMLTIDLSLPKGNCDGKMFLALTYPYTPSMLNNDMNLWNSSATKTVAPHNKCNSIFYHCGTLCLTVGGLQCPILTISSRKGMRLTPEKVPEQLSGWIYCRSENLAPTFPLKPVIFISARVHPGETCSSFVLRGFMQFLLHKDNEHAKYLRDGYVIKIVPILNLDGVTKGHYRTDSRGVNLNRVYRDPNPTLHPQIYAIKSLMKHYAKGKHLTVQNNKSSNNVDSKIAGNRHSAPVSTCHNKLDVSPRPNSAPNISCYSMPARLPKKTKAPRYFVTASTTNRKNHTANSFLSHRQKKVVARYSRLCLYMDLHGHVSKRGAFVYGNHLPRVKQRIQQLTFTRLLALQCAPYMDMNNCVFSANNMSRKDNHGESKEGSGRVAVYSDTALIHCYTLECNYDGGNIVNYGAQPVDCTKCYVFDTEAYAKVGCGIGQTLYEYFCTPNAQMKRDRTREYDLCNIWATRVVNRGRKIAPVVSLASTSKFCAFQVPSN